MQGNSHVRFGRRPLVASRRKGVLPGHGAGGPPYHSAYRKRDYSTSTYRKDIISRKWDVNRGALETKVREHQMKLVELASITGDTRDNRVLKYQRQLALTKDFRMLAVQKVLTNKGHETPGIDNMLIEGDEEK